MRYPSLRAETIRSIRRARRPTRNKEHPAGWRGVCFCGGSVFLGKHDGEDTGRDVGVARIGRACLHCPVVIVNLPENERAVDLHRPEIVLAMRVIVRRERIERLDGREHLPDKVFGQGEDPLRDQDPAVTALSSQIVIQPANDQHIFA